DAGFHLNVTAFESSLREPRRFQSRLNIHSKIDDIGDKLRMRLGLVPTAHDAETDVDVVFLHKSWNDGVQRALVSGNGIGLAGHQIKTCATVLKREPRAWSNQASTVACIITLDKRDDVAVLIDGGKIDSRVAVSVQLRSEERR